MRCMLFQKQKILFYLMNYLMNYFRKNFKMNKITFLLILNAQRKLIYYRLIRFSLPPSLSLFLSLSLSLSLSLFLSQSIYLSLYHTYAHAHETHDNLAEIRRRIGKRFNHRTKGYYRTVRLTIYG